MVDYAATAFESEVLSGLHGQQASLAYQQPDHTAQVTTGDGQITHVRFGAQVDPSTTSTAADRAFISGPSAVRFNNSAYRAFESIVAGSGSNDDFYAGFLDPTAPSDSKNVVKTSTGEVVIDGSVVESFVQTSNPLYIRVRSQSEGTPETAVFVKDLGDNNILIDNKYATISTNGDIRPSCGGVSSANGESLRVAWMRWVQTSIDAGGL